MGLSNTTGMADAVKDGQMPIEAAVAYHLQTNHYPPVHSVFIDTALEAIELAQRGKYDTLQTYPNGLRRTVGETVEGLHLAPFIEDEDDEHDFEAEQEAADAQREGIENR